MDTEYDRKFADMKKYIPFLECMIEKLENTAQTSEQPRKAQLDKIKSLRDLLLDKKKRMKMENLLKCEQVLVNLHAKMEQQSDILPKTRLEKPKQKADLESVRNKLKSVSKSLAEEDNQSDTFEIASRSETEELCTLGSKEPALFQRRANQAYSPSENKFQNTVPKRNYTRVLVSPEPSSKRWTDDTHSGKPLFSRRSPKKSPKKTSPTYHKKERKKSSSGKKKASKDLNITLNVPEESLSSLNTEDILSRIINCNDNDVDITTLRDLREQILGELQQTGAGDITEAIMKSYKKKFKLKKSKLGKKTEVEDGELSDSESEVIKRIYSSLVLADKGENTSDDVKSSNEKGKEPRKIQICLVFNKDNGDQEPGSTTNDLSEFELFDIGSNKEINAEKRVKEKDEKTQKDECASMNAGSVADNKENGQDLHKQTNKDIIDTKTKSDSSNDHFDIISTSDAEPNTRKTEEKSQNAVLFKPNFYNSLGNHDVETKTSQTDIKNLEQKSQSLSVDENSYQESDENTLYVKSEHGNKGTEKSKNKDKETTELETKQLDTKEVEKDNHQDIKDIRIPLLNEDPPVPLPPKEHVVSEIDILQALKNEILSEKIGISGGETSTPLLHQPKITKVASAQEIIKKRISIEKYKEKSVPVSKNSLFFREPSSSPKDDNAKKQSLKLTEKECERFNFPSKLALDDSSDEENDPVELDDIYGDLVPKSPEREDTSNTEYLAPVIIPVEPIKPTIVITDIDMRKLPLVSSSSPVLNLPVSPPTINILSSTTINLVSPSTINLVSPTKFNEASKNENKLEHVYRPPLVDPRLKWELNIPANARSPNSQMLNTERNSRPINYPNTTPSMTPNRTSCMTPNARTYEMTPSRQPFEIDENSSCKHVYAPILPMYEPLDQRETAVSKDNERQPHWEPLGDVSPEGRGTRWESSQHREGPKSRERVERQYQREQTKDIHKSRYHSRGDRYGYDKRGDYAYNRLDCPRTPVHPFGRSDCPNTPNASFGRLETPLTPVHPCGRSDGPSHSFSRSELPMTPSHPFGRSEASMTPLHQFGRSEVPMTPNHPFGRSDAPMTPSHPFGRSDYSQSSSKNFYKDPRLNRSANFESTSRNYDTDRDRGQFDDRRNTLDSSRHYKEKSVGISEMTYDGRGHGYNREKLSHRESSVGRSMTREYENNNMFIRDLKDNTRVRRGFQRNHSVGRGTPSADRYRSLSRGPSNYTDNTLSVEPQSGHSFTIDTSVNRTFQEFLNQKGLTPLVSSFEERRQRASSVGRALVSNPNSFDARRQRSSSVGRALLPDPYSFDARRQRASSVGRTVIPVESLSRHLRESSVGRTFSSLRSQSIGKFTSNYRIEKTLKEIKDDFKSYSASLRKAVISKPEKQINNVDPRRRKDKKQSEQLWGFSNSSKPYSPRKNTRDPRFRRELQNESRKNTNNKEFERKRHGIVYSSDNIAKGTILGSGYGVKNYKIPKIKRPVEENVEDTENVTTSEKKDKEKCPANEEKKGQLKTLKDNTEKANKDTVKEKSGKVIAKEKNILEIKSTSSDVKTAKRNTRAILKRDSGKKFSDYQVAVKSRKYKRAVITDSDCDDENSSIENKDKIEKKSLLKEKTKPEANVTHKSCDIKSDKNQDDLLDTSFGMEDLEIPDNINALIANLDNDLRDNKYDKRSQFTKELSIENLLESIDSPEDKEMTVEESLKDLSDLINADLDSSKLKNSSQTNRLLNKNLGNNDSKGIFREIEKEINLQSSEVLKENELSKIFITNEKEMFKDNETNKSFAVSKPQIHLNKHSCVTSVREGLINEPNQQEIISIQSTQKPDDTKQNTDDDKYKNIVSTTDIGNEVIGMENINESEQESNEQLKKSTPDSTNESPVFKEDQPDSTNEFHNELHSDVTSSHETAEISNKATTSSKETASELSSVENILNLLQDKSKIKQLLSMIGGNKTCENERLKKKLEKLSEIVSEDDESTDATVKNVTATSDVKNSSVAKESINTDEKNNENISNENEDINEKVNGEPEQMKNQSSKDNQTQGKESLSSTAAKNLKVPGKKFRRGKKKLISGKAKRVTRSGAAALRSTKVKPKENRELKQLQDDIKEMFIKDDVLNATGIRMCRLAKFTEDKYTNEEDDIEPRPVVVLEKFKHEETFNEKPIELKTRKKPGPKAKSKVTLDKPTHSISNKDVLKTSPKLRPGPKSKTKSATRSTADPYDFGADSDTTKNSDGGFPSSESEDDSLASSASFGSSEVLAELKKKPKRKRGRAWQSGVIKPKKKKKKVDSKPVDSSADDHIVEPQKDITIPDMNSFTDRTYCFLKNINVYLCRLCDYSGDDIVHHYKTRHPHSEIPLSRMNPETARDAIKESEEINFQAISKVSTEKYVCRFCFKEFISRRKDTLLETFFWHVVSTHTGEYKQLCSECINVTRCPFNLDIPPPPKDVNGQLIGYICEKCNYTQLSLENLKTHVIVRHNDEKTSVYMINLAFMTKKTIKSAMEEIEQIERRVLRSSRSNQSVTEQSDERSDISESTECLIETGTQKNQSMPDSSALESVPKVKKLRSKLTFETEDNVSDISNLANSETSIKGENRDEVDHDHNADEKIHHEVSQEVDREKNLKTQDHPLTNREIRSHGATDEVVDLPHFKVSFTDAGAKEYVCCINGKDNHYKTPLLISMKKHVQLKHKENWDGYCSICKVIVTPQGAHTFKDCFQHLLDNHIDNFPELERNAPMDSVQSVPVKPSTLPRDDSKTVKTADKPTSPKLYINVRPLSDLVLINSNLEPEQGSALPVIESVVSLGISNVDSQPSPIPTTDEETLPRQPTPPRSPTPPPRQPSTNRPPSVPPLAPTSQKPIDFEKFQTDVIAKKQQVVLDAMMSHDTLVHIFKCAGRYCCFSTDVAEHALLHASSHQRLGGENSLICAYCDFDCSGNAIDLVTHVFKVHGRCQFACSQCFYRAVASQLVSAHIIRMHGDAASQGVVLKTTAVTPGKDDAPTDQLTREVAVAHYTCINAPSTCKYKTYIHLKFGEHLEKHEPPFLCNVCPVGFPIVSALLEHLKYHGMKLYQCTWCVYGADDEACLLAHASAHHPVKVPQAYLRIVTTKEAPDGTLRMMVLPLAQFNNSLVPTETVTPCSKKENPLKAAERALELEKLIGSISAFSTATSSTVQESKNVTNDKDGITEDQILTDNVEKLIPETPHTPPTMIRDDLSTQTTPVLKSEPMDETPVQAHAVSSEVITLDSDEEDSRPGVIDISDEDASHPGVLRSVSQEVSADKLFKCPKQHCTYLCKRVHIFKKHLQFCCLDGVALKCAHCPIEWNTIQGIVEHYEEQHGKRNKVCGICGLRDSSIAYIKKHFTREHGSKDLLFTSNRDKDGSLVLTVRDSPNQPQKVTPQKEKPVTRQKPGPKRKLSSGNLAESPAKKKRYGPQDIDQLPAKPILDALVYCALCEFSTKVRLNLVRHLQLHAEKQPVAQTVPVNPVPHLETNEKHFDKMVNLASSSVVNRGPDKPVRADPVPSVSLLIPPEAASRYPRYIPERQRLTCGAKDCSYTSLDEAMFKCHWETLHAGTNDYHCVHCPPYQHLDTSKPLIASRIIAHLKMHDIRLYACNSCTYYHYKRPVVEKHLNEAHQGLGQVMVVREEWTQPTPTTSQPLPSSGPSMDLKPWQCGLCKFKSMLRQEVVEHCAHYHNSKMQFKCPNCPFRTSTIENVTKHQSKSHPGSTETVIYFYYREGSIPDDADGTPRWLKQRQRMGTVEPEVKEEVPDKSIPETTMPPVLHSLTSPAVDLSKVKKEIPDANTVESIEDLCKTYGQFCEPNGLKYKCPLCKIVDDDSKECMQSHLFEELQYRKWGCGMCTYKAFHKAGLNDHMLTEHRQNRDPIELPLDHNVEKWVAQLLQHQTDLIGKTKDNFAKHKIQVGKPRVVATSKAQDKPSENTTKSKEELEQAFGPLGAATDDNFCCPKCPFRTRDHSKMQDHLESELNKIRWRCTKCGGNFQEYHEAQLHCRTAHGGVGVGARPAEALRDPTVRAAWVAACLRLQRAALSDLTHPAESPTKTALAAVAFVPAVDPLLEVRYEKYVPTPEEEMLARRKRPAPVSPDSDDERLVIDEHDETSELEPKKKNDTHKCQYCDFTTRYVSSVNDHVLRHYNLKPYTCGYCDFNCYITQCKTHHETYHPDLRSSFFKTKLPAGLPTNLNLVKKGRRILSSDTDQPKPKEDPKDDAPKVHVTCLVCEKSVVESDCSSHVHENIPMHFGKKGEIVVKCCNCWTLLPNVAVLQEHHSSKHSNAKLNYAYYKLGHDTREIHACDHCDKRFKFLRDLKSHHNAVHGAWSQLKHSMKPYTPEDVHIIELEDDKEKKVGPAVKMVARKSTTKLPSQTVAKKSTTKLPFFYFETDSENEEEYSYYGTKPQPLGDYTKITALMPFCNKLTAFTVKQLSDIIKVDPKVVVSDINKRTQ